MSQELPTKYTPPSSAITTLDQMRALTQRLGLLTIHATFASTKQEFDTYRQALIEQAAEFQQLLELLKAIDN